MNARLKHLAGLLSAAMGCFFALGTLAELSDPARETPLWICGFFFLTLGLLPMALSIKLLRRRALELPQRRCPTCGGVERAAAGLMVNSHNPWMYHFGGWLLGSLWGASRRQQVRCVTCDSLYFTETRGTRVAGILLWIVILFVLAGLTAEFLSL